MTKKLISLFTIVLCISLLSTNVFANYTDTSGTDYVDGYPFKVTGAIAINQRSSSVKTYYGRSTGLILAKAVSTYGSGTKNTTRKQSYEGGTVTASFTAPTGYSIYRLDGTGNVTLPNGGGSLTRYVTCGLG